MKFLGNRSLSQALTLLFLAIWHGFHVGYYVCFFMELIIMTFEKDVSIVTQELFNFKKRMYYIVNSSNNKRSITDLSFISLKKTILTLHCCDNL